MKNLPKNLTTLVAALLLSSGCTTVRQLREPASIPSDGRAQRTRTDKALDYSVGIRIAAPPEKVWTVLTEASAYPSWNSAVTRLAGRIELGSEIELVSKVAPDRVFKLKVSELEAPRKLVWEDGGRMFLGVRTFTLAEDGNGGTTFSMSETFSGGMLGMIEGSLPDFTKSFEAFAGDLKRKAEEPIAAR